MAPASLLFSALTAFLAVATVQAVPAGNLEARATASATAAAIASQNGPYSNPYDTSSAPVTWPGLPTKGQSTPTSRPGPAFPSGGLPQFASKYKAPAWVPKGKTDLIAQISSALQNGNSPWGIIDKPGLGYNLPPGKGPQYTSVYSRPTTTLTVGQTPTAGPCGTAPDTGVTRTYDFKVSHATIAPDGVKKNGLVVNGGFPGPLIEANWGDYVEVTVTNNLPDEGTSLHWHGLLQSETPWFDGVPAVSQCPLAPGETMVYKFKADGKLDRPHLTWTEN